jgi:osmotically-inducible protein OsmY
MMMPEYNKTGADYNVTSKVRIALKVHEETEKLLKDLKVGTANGVVHLMGKVPTEEARLMVERVARAVPDVLSIVNELEVAS